MDAGSDLADGRAGSAEKAVGLRGKRVSLKQAEICRDFVKGNVKVYLSASTLVASECLTKKTERSIRDNYSTARDTTRIKKRTMIHDDSP